MANLGVAYRDAGRLTEAIALLEEVLGRVRDHLAQVAVPQLAWVAPVLAGTYELAGRFAKAEPFYRSFVEQATKQFGAADVRASRPLDQLGLNLLKQQKYVEAEKVLHACLKIRAANQPDAWTTFNTQSMLGNAFLGQKKFADAEPLLLEGYEGMKQREANLPPREKTRLIEALERLVQLYEAIGQQGKAADWRQHLEQAQATQKKTKA
jgi:tetratricopeptide (TPR) repeat protein